MSRLVNRSEVVLSTSMRVWADAHLGWRVHRRSGLSEDGGPARSALERFDQARADLLKPPGGGGAGVVGSPQEERSSTRPPGERVDLRERICRPFDEMAPWRWKMRSDRSTGRWKAGRSSSRDGRRSGRRADSGRAIRRAPGPPRSPPGMVAGAGPLGAATTGASASCRRRRGVQLRAAALASSRRRPVPFTRQWRFARR